MASENSAIAGLCPITEASLGDGIFDGVNWFDAGGKIAIGSDSNIRISLTEELRGLEYSQRLRDRSRAALATSTASTGRHILDAAIAGGAEAAGRHTGQIAPGYWADLMALNQESVPARRKGDHLIDSFIFAVTTILFKMFGPQADTLSPVDDIGTVTRLSQPIIKQWPACERNYNHMKWPK